MLPHFCPAWLGLCSSLGIATPAKEFLPSPSESTNNVLGQSTGGGEQQSFFWLLLLLSQFNFQKIGCLLQFRNAAEEMQLRSCCEKNTPATLLWGHGGEQAPDRAQRAAKKGAGGERGLRGAGEQQNLGHWTVIPRVCDDTTQEEGRERGSPNPAPRSRGVGSVGQGERSAGSLRQLPGAGRDGRDGRDARVRFCRGRASAAPAGRLLWHQGVAGRCRNETAPALPASLCAERAVTAIRGFLCLQRPRRGKEGIKR